MAHNSLTDIARAAAEYAQAHFQAGDTEQPAQWAVPLDDHHQLGMARNAHDGSVVLTAWRLAFNDAPGFDDPQGEALLRRSFDTRLGAGLIGGISPELGPSLSLPLYAACDAQALHDIAEALLRELERLAGPAPDDAPPAPLPRGPQGDARQAERDLARLARACGRDALPAGARQFDLLFDDLPGRVTLHPDNRRLLTDFFLHDAAVLHGSLRRAVIKSALLVNQNALRGHAYVVGLDSRQFVTGTGRIALDRLDDDTWPRWLQYQLAQARDTRALVRDLALEGAQISFGMSAGAASAAAPGALV
ncbi:hypothetical protein ACOTF1_25415 [Achromobacter ruhlandii]|uniref:hypothetical protein n=1 Tax=Achromobacter ruhlandii TaxID=72557 RepID=UPI002DBAA04B|nr:hypothetical protein [Achromobacter ruhlandii]MEB6663265.1 hypothetical protein [Achromobacter ruhlandii]